MRSHKGLGRTVARAKIKENKAEKKTAKAERIAPKYVILMNRIERNPEFQKPNNMIVVSEADLDASLLYKNVSGRKRRKAAHKAWLMLAGM